MMKPILMLAGATALAFAGPALAKPGHGQGQGKGKGHAHAPGLVSPYGQCNGYAPPGLAKKPGCMPPGQYRKMFSVGQRLPLGVFSPYGYNQIPYDLRSQYGLNPYQNYYYGNGYLYGVNPKTMLIQQVIAALLR